VKKLKNTKGCHRQKLSDTLSAPLVLEKNEAISGIIGWCGILSAIIVYDAYAIKSKKIETLTRFFWRMTEQPITGSIITGAWIGLSFHLLIEKLIRKALSGQ